MNLNLFKYYAPKYNDNWNLSFWEKESFYFQSPNKFNDPWDCKLPRLKIPRQKSTLKTVHKYMTLPHGERYSVDTWNKLISMGRAEQRNFYIDKFNESIEDLRDRVGVYSTSCIPNSELLWAHYAESHRGYCLHICYDFAEYFKDKDLINFGLPIPVKYTNDRQEWKVGHYFANSTEFLYNLIRFKSASWSYEYEVRLLNNKHNGFIKYPKNWIKGIIVGLAVDLELQERLKIIAKSLNVPIYKAKMDDIKYKVNIPGLNYSDEDGIASYNYLINSNLYGIQ